MLRKFIAENSLTIALAALFAIFLCGQFYSGYLAYNGDRNLYHLPSVGYWEYARTGNFLNGIFANWQAAILQLGSLIIFSIFFVQRGATHSKEPGRQGTKKKRPRYLRMHHFLSENSLSVAFILLFIFLFLLHLASGREAVNETRGFVHARPLSLSEFFLSAEFWFLTFQTWQAEYMAIALYIVLSVFLRQEGSPESKPTDASDGETGKANK